VKDRISGFFILKAIYLPPTSGRRLILTAAGDSISSEKQLQIARNNKLDIRNAVSVIKHLKGGGTLLSFICED